MRHYFINSLVGIELLQFLLVDNIVAMHNSRGTRILAIIFEIHSIIGMQFVAPIRISYNSYFYPLSFQPYFLQAMIEISRILVFVAYSLLLPDILSVVLSYSCEEIISSSIN